MLQYGIWTCDTFTPQWTNWLADVLSQVSIRRKKPCDNFSQPGPDSIMVGGKRDQASAWWIMMHMDRYYKSYKYR